MNKPLKRHHLSITANGGHGPAEPSTALDRAILKRARRATRSRAHRHAFWVWPLSVAAGAVICLTIFLQLASLAPTGHTRQTAVASATPTPPPSSTHAAVAVGRPQNQGANESMVIGVVKAQGTAPREQAEETATSSADNHQDDAQRQGRPGR